MARHFQLNFIIFSDPIAESEERLEINQSNPLAVSISVFRKRNENPKNQSDTQLTISYCALIVNC